MATNVTDRVSITINVENFFAWEGKVWTETFNSKVVKFKMNIYPKLTSPKDLTVHLYAKSASPSEYFIKMTLFILTKGNKQVTIGDNEVKVSANITWKKIAAFDIQEELNQKHRYIFGRRNVLTLVFTAGVVDLGILMSDQCATNSGTTKLLTDMENLMKNREKCDAILCAEDLCEFHVHKWVLCARSQVFDVMFETDMLEQETNSVWIQDMSSMALKEMIYFLYTGKVRTVDPDVLLDLYEAAEKYFLCDLKFEAGRLLSMNLNDAVVRCVAATAYLHRDMNLLNNAVRYIYQNKESVLKLDGWLRFQPYWLRYVDAIRRSSFGS